MIELGNNAQDHACTSYVCNLALCDSGILYVCAVGGQVQVKMYDWWWCVVKFHVLCKLNTISFHAMHEESCIYCVI